MNVFGTHSFPFRKRLKQILFIHRDVRRSYRVSIFFGTNILPLKVKIPPRDELRFYKPFQSSFSPEFYSGHCEIETFSISSEYGFVGSSPEEELDSTQRDAHFNGIEHYLSGLSNLDHLLNEKYCWR